MAQLVMAAACIPAVVEQYSDMVLRIAYQHMQSRADAEDVAQDVFLRLLGQPAFADETHLKAWLIRVTINRCKDMLKSAWRRKTVPIEQDWPTMDTPDQAVMEELFLLKPDERDILYLFYYEKYTIAEIAKMLGKNLNTVNSRLARARKKLRDILTEGDTQHG